MGLSNKSSSMFFLGALFVALMATTAPFGANGQLLPNLTNTLPIVGAQVIGQIVCLGNASTVLQPQVFPVSNATAVLRCLNSTNVNVTVTLAVAVSTTGGNVTLTVIGGTNAVFLALNIATCTVQALLPVTPSTTPLPLPLPSTLPPLATLIPCVNLTATNATLSAILIPVGATINGLTSLTLQYILGIISLIF